MPLRLMKFWPFRQGREVFTYCFAHRGVRIPPPPGACLVELGAPGSVKDGRFSRHINAYEVVPDGEAHHPYLAGSLGSFAVLRDLKARGAPPDALVNITHYRRFTYPEALGAPADNYKGMMVVREAEIAHLEIEKPLRALKTPFLFSQPLTQPSIIQSYRRAHVGEDLEAFAECAVAVSVLTEGEVAEWFAQSTLIPGGVEYGVSPVAVYLDLVGRLERVSRAFLASRRPASDDVYQRRALNFCCERLGSYLLIRAFQDRFGGQTPPGVFGYMHVVEQSGRYSLGQD